MDNFDAAFIIIGIIIGSMLSFMSVSVLSGGSQDQCERQSGVECEYVGYAPVSK